MKKVYWISALVAGIAIGAQAQTFKGHVMYKNEAGALLPLVGANVTWLNTKKGTVTDISGFFVLKADSAAQKVVFSFIGFESDTLDVESTMPQIPIRVVMTSSKTLKEVTIVDKRGTTYISALNPINTQLVTEKELLKAACCNLSESFETNPSVDVAFADAVTGAKQIQMLGLAGIYTQLTTENLPGARGLAANYGLTYTPGTWIESIQVTKGIGSVANGYESIAGQINVELKKPEAAEKLLVNTYANQMGRIEANLNIAHKLNKRWSSVLLAHGNYLGNKLDMNKDGFMDLPTGQQVNVLNRWKFDNGKGVSAQAGVRVMEDNRTGGQLSFDSRADRQSSPFYGIGLRTARAEVFGKLGYVFADKKYKSIGLMASATAQKQANYYGRRSYDAEQQTFYSNLIYQSIIGSTAHKFRTGASFVYDAYDERLQNFNLPNYQRNEIVPGVFFEHTYSNMAKFTLVTGIRADYHNLYGLMYTPRLHAKYDITETTTLRASAGRGQRVANVLAENSAVFASARQVTIQGGSTGKAYGLNPEEAWNAGLNLVQEFRLFYHKGTLSLDYYRTDFQNQVVVDLDHSPQAVLFYNLTGRSFANSLQAELNYEPIKNLDIRLAYRLFDVQTDYKHGLLQKPLVAKHRFFVNLAYETGNKAWKFDYTFQTIGAKRLPYVGPMPAGHNWQSSSPAYMVMNAQVTKIFDKKWDVYLGCENMTDYTQHDLIVSADQPFSPRFDASLVWGPVIGRMVYAGFRYHLK